MEITEKDIKRLSVLFIIIGLIVISYFLIRPILFAIIGGLLLAYIFMPLFKFVNRKIHYRWISAAIVSLFVIFIIVVVLWFILPLLAEQIFQIFRAFQNFDIQKSLEKILPSGSEQFTTQLTVTINGLISKAASGLLNTLVNSFFDAPKFILNIFVIALVFFYALRDFDKLEEFVSGLSPLAKNKERILVRQFREITDSIIYGQVFVGVIQGILAGIGFFVLGVPNTIALTALAILFSIIPFVGAFIIWVPVAGYVFLNYSLITTILFVLYNLTIVSTLDNFLRAYIVSKNSSTSTITILIGMIGGIFIFGVIGLILGPLILVYLITFLKAYKEKTLSNLFNE